MVCADTDAARVKGLERGVVPFHEPGLADLVADGRRSGRLAFTTEPAPAVRHGEVLFVAVDTDAGPDGAADVSRVLEVAAAIGRHLDARKIVVTKSTVPVGTACRVRERIGSALAERGATVAFDVASNPEFLSEGNAVAGFMRPDRIVIGSDGPYAARRLARLYAPFNRNRDRMLHMDVRSAELTKYAANAMLAARVSLMNELAGLAERFGADIEAVRRGVGADPRVGSNYLYAGTGYGGPCLAKDLRGLIRAGETAGSEVGLLRAVESVNARQKLVLFEKMRGYFRDGLRGRTIAVWGLAFKPGTDDMREAPSRVLMERLWEAGACVRAYDPAAAESARRLYGDRPDLVLCAGCDSAVTGADALAVLTEWPAFWSPDFRALKRLLRRPAIFDGRNLYDPSALRAMGFDHFPVGRPRD